MLTGNQYYLKIDGHALCIGFSFDNGLISWMQCQYAAHGCIVSWRMTAY